MNASFFFIAGTAGQSTGNTQAFPDALQQTHIPVLTFEFCQDLYSLEMTENMMCAGRYGVGQHDTCQVSLHLIIKNVLGVISLCFVQTKRLRLQLRRC